jgi:hypothetical protein
LVEPGFEVLCWDGAYRKVSVVKNIAELSEDPDLYEFVLNHPIGLVDSLGLQTAGGFPVDPNQPVYPYGNNGPNNTDPEAPEEPDSPFAKNSIIGPFYCLAKDLQNFSSWLFSPPPQPSPPNTSIPPLPPALPGGGCTICPVNNPVVNIPPFSPPPNWFHP